MLSIAIPVYNFEVVDLCSSLDRQARQLGIDFEILCYDDLSQPEFRNINRRLDQIESLDYKELKENLGRSKIRNLLAKDAKYDQILFMDCDSEVESEDYLSTYINLLDKEKVIYGGRSYKPEADQVSHILRWKYGVMREVRSAEERSKNPYRSFMTNNFIVDKESLAECPFNEDLDGYGHEDTLFALDLKQSGIRIRHVDNALCHIGLEDAEEYLRKTKQGVKNLSEIIKMGKLGANNKLYGTYLKLKKYSLLGLCMAYIRRNESKMIENLKSPTPNLRNFDLLKIFYLSQYL